MAQQKKLVKTKDRLHTGTPELIALSTPWGYDDFLVNVEKNRRERAYKKKLYLRKVNKYSENEI
jgi:hypothetical protein